MPAARSTDPDVSKSVMPKGVEHATPAVTVPARRSRVEVSDAERR